MASVNAFARVLLIGGLLVILGACTNIDLSGSLPPRPSPFPTLERLPSITPITPSPTLLPTFTPRPQTPTPTVSPLQALVNTTSNLRAGPGTEYAIVTIVEIGSSVELRTRSNDWYEIATSDGDEGWIFGNLLDVDPTTAAAVPLAQP